MLCAVSYTVAEDECFFPLCYAVVSRRIHQREDATSANSCP